MRRFVAVTALCIGVIASAAFFALQQCQRELGVSWRRADVMLPSENGAVLHDRFDYAWRGDGQYHKPCVSVRWGASDKEWARAVAYIRNHPNECKDSGIGMLTHWGAK